MLDTWLQAFIASKVLTFKAILFTNKENARFKTLVGDMSKLPNSKGLLIKLLRIENSMMDDVTPTNEQPEKPLHGITLEAIVRSLEVHCPTSP